MFIARFDNLFGILIPGFICFLASTAFAQSPPNPINSAISKTLLDSVLGPAVTELKPAAEAGDARAQFKLGQAYYSRGHHTNGVYWLRKAAKQGLAEAQFAYGNTLFPGYPRNVPKDSKEALRWISLAAHQNHSQAQLTLAHHLENGTVSRPDPVEAMKWLTILIKHRPEYRIFADRLALKLTTEQIAEAQRRAAAFQPSPSFSVGPELKLQAITGSGDRRLAMINGQSFAQGESGSIKSDGDVLQIRCIEIKTDSVLIQVHGESQTRTLSL
ncbi:MAG: tetratricopeptide repeat protein [Limisphaerales bacterium]